jgi:hypothetical protein
MAKFRKKPVVVEAEQFDGSRECASRLSLLYASNVWPEFGESSEFTGRMVIDTLEGRMIASKGDWIITGVNSERYPCKPDIFEKTYEAV